jgi:hypothetical protein
VVEYTKKPLIYDDIFLSYQGKISLAWLYRAEHSRAAARFSALAVGFVVAVRSCAACLMRTRVHEEGAERWWRRAVVVEGVRGCRQRRVRPWGSGTEEVAIEGGRVVAVRGGGRRSLGERHGGGGAS